MFGNLGIGELTIVMIIVLVLFGAKRVPEISASFGKGIREFKRNLNDVEGSVTGAVAPGRYEAPPAPYSRSLERASGSESPSEPIRDDSRAEPKRLL